MMMLSSFQDPPRALGASASTVTGPPAAETFFRWPSAKKPMNLPSADQNGNEAPSVPSSFLAVSSLRDRTQIESRSFGVRAQNATAVPSGEITGGPEKSPVKSNPVSTGGIRKDRIDRAGSGSRKFDQTSSASKATITATQRRRSRHQRRTEIGGAVLTAEPLVATQRNSRPISAALCHRNSGSFTTQSAIT